MESKEELKRLVLNVIIILFYFIWWYNERDIDIYFNIIDNISLDKKIIIY